MHSELIRTNDPEGFVYIEDNRFNLAVGGVRLISGVDEREVRLLAKAMSDKLHTFGLPISGAKGAINSDDIEDFYKFINKESIKNLIKGKEDVQLITGPDIGTSEDEYYNALRKANLEEFIRPGLLSQISEQYGLPMDNIVTSYGVVVAIEELLRRDKSSDPLEGKKIVIEGFGKVGTGLAKILANRCKIVGISTRYGCIQNDVGFNVDELLDLQRAYGDHLVEHVDEDILSTEDLFSIPCDILIPGARTEVISKNIGQRIISSRPTAIVPVSNYPYTEEGIEILSKTGIICFPDYIASAGAVIAAMVEFCGSDNQEHAMSLVHAAISFETRELLIQSRACSDSTKTMIELSKENVQRKRDQLVKKYAGSKIDIEKVANNIIEKYLPSLIN